MKLLKWLKNSFPTALCVIGAGCIGYGVILINLPAGIIMTGILLVGFGVILIKGGGD